MQCFFRVDVLGESDMVLPNVKEEVNLCTYYVNVKCSRFFVEFLNNFRWILGIIYIMKIIDYLDI